MYHPNGEKELTYMLTTIDKKHINYPEEIDTPTAYLCFVNMSLNSIILTPGARFAHTHSSNFHLIVPLKRPECTRIVFLKNEFSRNTTDAQLQPQIFWFTSIEVYVLPGTVSLNMTCFGKIKL